MTDATPETPAVTLPKVWRPMGPRIMGLVLVVGLFGLCAIVWIGFTPKVRATFSGSEVGTMFFFGLLILALVYALTRSRVEAREDRLIVVNGFRRWDFAWPQVVAVRLPPGAPWVTLDLADGETVSAMGIQSSDGGRARLAARQLARLVAERG
jgi:hypothetical protein